jgi:hypothetical protein
VLEELESHRDGIMRLLESEEPECFTGEDAALVVGVCAEIERLATAGKLRYARRVEESNLHKRDGHKRAGTFLASVTGEPVGQAAASLALARAIESHPVIEEAFRRGELSEGRARQLASVAEVRPEAVTELVSASGELGFAEFSDRCRQARSASETAEESVARYERMRAKRYCRTWTDQEGFGRVEARMTPDALAVFRAGLERNQKKYFEAARASREFESPQAYAADALVDMASASAGSGASGGSSAPTSGPRIVVRLRVDLSALRRGRTVDGERCEVVGGGQLPVPVVASQLDEAVLELVATRGQEVVSICTDSRHISKVLRIALEERDRVCIVPGCGASDQLEIDHWRTEFAKGGKTQIDNLCRICRHHHQLKTYGGWAVEGGPGHWRMVKVEPPPGGLPALPEVG